MLYDKGLFKYEDKISQHWPNFSQNGKKDIKICDVLRHESGLANFSKSIPSIKDAWPENIKINKIGKIIEEEKQQFPSISRTEYHAISRGLIINEIVRRVDPQVRILDHIFLVGDTHLVSLIHVAVCLPYSITSMKYKFK